MDLAAGKLMVHERRSIRHVDPILVAAAIGLASITATGNPVTGSLSRRVPWMPGSPRAVFVG